ncbi:hypothetical protein K523DRAFT_358518 [Schizophyllum commune Tattone D]|nr:hypothetical protein K523DRAFT_358518 [Schizophyllum commune Tattone D]
MPQMLHIISHSVAWASGYYTGAEGEITLLPAPSPTGVLGANTSKTRSSSRSKNTLGAERGAEGGLTRTRSTRSAASEKDKEKGAPRGLARTRSTKSAISEKDKAAGPSRAEGGAKPVKKTRSLRSVPSAAALRDDSAEITVSIDANGKGMKSKAGQEVTYACSISTGVGKGKDMTKTLLLGKELKANSLDAMLHPYLLGMAKGAAKTLTVPHARAIKATYFGRLGDQKDVSINIKILSIGPMQRK